jgi:hypothetical protein
MRQDAIDYINATILRQAQRLTYNVSSVAPNTERDLFNESGLVVWSGASDSTIYRDASVNWAFRALHDALHLKTKLDFSPLAEIELGRIQASLYDSDLMRELMYCEVSLQASHFETTGSFVLNQVEFTLKHLSKVSSKLILSIR